MDFNVYVVVVSNGRYEDYFVGNEGVFSTREKAEQFLINKGYKQDEYTKTWCYEEKYFGDVPQREWFNTDEDYQYELECYNDAIANDEPYDTEIHNGYIEKWPLQ